MTPWWLRPTAEGASKEETPQEPAYTDRPSETPTEAAASSELPSVEPAVQAAEWTSAPVEETPTAESSVPATPPAAEIPASPRMAVPPAEPPPPAAPAATGWRSWRQPSEEVAPPVSSILDREPEPAPSYYATERSPYLEPPASNVTAKEPAAEASAAPVETPETLDALGVPPPARGGRLGGGPEQNNAAEPTEITETGEVIEAEVVEISSAAEPAGETEEAREGRRRTRRRGGRRRNGRAAAETALSAQPEEDEAEEDEVEAPVAIAPPARRPPIQEDAVFRRREAFDYEAALPPREIVVTVPERRSADERKIALFCDLENVALGVRDSDIKKFDIELVLERLLEKGKIIVKKAYADWERYSDYKRPFHEAAIELIDIPQKHYSGKNSADIKMVVDAMDLSYSKEHLDTFVLLSGDSDFSPLVSKLKENNKYVIGIGVKNSSSALLIDNCDEFIFYEDVWRDQQKAPHVVGVNKKSTEAFSLMVESIQALLRENKDVLWGSMIKQTMQRKKPAFNEGYYGYSTFSELLEDAERNNVIKLKKDQRSGTYIVTGFAGSKR